MILKYNLYNFFIFLQSTFDNLQTHFKNIEEFGKESRIVLLVGNKCDLTNDKVVSTEAVKVNRIF